MKKRILCYTDFSKNALNAINYTIQLYEHQSCVFYFLNAFQGNKDASDIIALALEPDDKIFEEAKRTSEESLKIIKEDLLIKYKNPKHSYETISSYNSLLFALKDTITNNAISLLAISSKDSLDSEDDENIPTLDVMEYITECSILAIPGDYKFSGLKKMVLPINYEETINQVDFTEMLNIIKLHQPEINLLHIEKERHLDDNQVKNRKLLASILKGLKYSFHTLTDIGVHKGIKLFIESEQCDLAVFIDERSDYIGNELPRTLLKELDKHLWIPVLAVNAKVT